MRTLATLSLILMSISSIGAASLMIDGTVTGEAFDGGPRIGESYRFVVTLPSIPPIDRASSEIFGLYTSGDGSISFSGGATGSLEDVGIWIHIGNFFGADGVVVRTNMSADRDSPLSDSKYWFQHLEFRFGILSDTFSDDSFGNYDSILNTAELQSSELLMFWDTVGAGSTGLNGEVSQIRLIPEPNSSSLLIFTLIATATRRRKCRTRV